MDAAVGGRVGLLRYGTENNLLPEGFQFDAEAAAFPRLQLNQVRDLAGVDFRAGAVLTLRSGPWETKFAFYHLCSHLGDQYLLENPGVERVNFSRDALVLGLAYRPIPDVRFYGEVGWAFDCWGDTEPWEFQFGIEYSPARPTGLAGSPFFAINAHFRQEVQFRRRPDGANRLAMARPQRASLPHRPGILQRQVRAVPVHQPVRAADRRRHLVRLLSCRVPRLARPTVYSSLLDKSVGWVERSEPHQRVFADSGGARCARPTLRILKTAISPAAALPARWSPATTCPDTCGPRRSRPPASPPRCAVEVLS